MEQRQPSRISIEEFITLKIEQVLLTMNAVPEKAIDEFGIKLHSTYGKAHAMAEFAKKAGIKRVIVPIEIFAGSLLPQPIRIDRERSLMIRSIATSGRVLDDKEKVGV